MRGTLALALALLTVSACALLPPAESTPTSSPPSADVGRFSTTVPRAGPAGSRIVARGSLRVGIRYDLEPFGFVTAEGKVAGFDVDLGRQLALRWLGDAAAVEFIQVRSDTALEKLQAGEVDLVIAALVHTMDREADADFSLPYFVDGQAVLVRGADTALVRGASDLDGRRVGVVTWSNAHEALLSAAPITPTLIAYDRFDEAVAALGRGEVDAVADLRRRLLRGTRLLPGSAIVGQYTWVPVAVAYPQNDPDIADLVNLTLQDLSADGTLAGLSARWLRAEETAQAERWPGSGATPSLSGDRTPRSIPDTSSAVASRGRLVAAVIADRPPFAYVDASGALAGYDVDLVRALASIWLGDATAVDFVPVSEAAGKEMVFTGQADMLVGGLAHTRQTELEMDLSLTIYVAGQGLVVHNSLPVAQVADLQGLPVAVVDGSPSLDALQSAVQAAGISVQVQSLPDLDSAINQLMAGQVAGVAADRALLLGPAYATPDLTVLPWRLTEVPLAIGLPEGDSAFRDLVNLTLQAMRNEGQFAGLYSIWFYDTPPAHTDWPGVPYRELTLDVPEAGDG
jgi:ABC-type amino acid transport substrate-binding protein